MDVLPGGSNMGIWIVWLSHTIGSKRLVLVWWNRRIWRHNKFGAWTKARFPALSACQWDTSDCNCFFPTRPDKWSRKGWLGLLMSRTSWPRFSNQVMSQCSKHPRLSSHNGMASLTSCCRSLTACMSGSNQLRFTRLGKSIAWSGLQFKKSV